MKQIWVAMVLASSLFALTGAVFFARAANRPADGPAAGDDASAAATVSALESRLREALERVERLESSLERLRSERRKPAALLAQPTTAGAPDASAEGEVADSPEEEVAETAEEKALLAALDGGKAEGLRGFVHQVIQEEREERRQEDQRRMLERQRELEEMNQGPYGQYNFRMNTISRRLGLSEGQKARYHALLADYSTRIEEMRSGLDRNDPVAYQSYRDRKKQITDEFDGLVLQTLDPEQAQTYADLPSREKSPASEHIGGGNAVFISTAADGSIEAGMRVMTRAMDVLTLPAPPPSLGPGSTGGGVSFSPGTAPVLGPGASAGGAPAPAGN